MIGKINNYKSHYKCTQHFRFSNLQKPMSTNFHIFFPSDKAIPDFQPTVLHSQ